MPPPPPKAPGPPIVPDYSRWQLSQSSVPGDRRDLLAVTSRIGITGWYVDYASYYARLEELLMTAAKGDEIFVAGWLLDIRQSLSSKTIGELLTAAINAGASVRLLLPHGDPRNEEAVDTVKANGGKAALDAHQRAGALHHQKAVYLKLKSGSEQILFVGGMDIAGGRFGWHDLMIELNADGARFGRATLDERWHDVTGEINAIPPTGQGNEHTLTQYVRTYGKTDSKDAARTYAKNGDFSYHALLKHGIETAQNFIFIVDQYFLGCKDPSGNGLRSLSSLDDDLALALQKKTSSRSGDGGSSTQKLSLFVITARSEQIEAEGWRPWERRKRFIETLTASIPDKERVKIYVFKKKHAERLLNYIHTKAWLFDDRFMVVGSANFNRCSMSSDSDFGVGIASDITTFSPGPKVVPARLLRMDLTLDILNAHSPAHPFTIKSVLEFGNWANALESKESPLERYDPNGGTDTTRYNEDQDGS